MAPARRGQSPNGAAARVRYAEESDDADTDHEAARPQKSHHKKRISEAYLPEDASFTMEAGGSGGRIPLKSVNTNDDEAERRRRRKSAKMTVLDNSVAGPSSEGTQDASADASRSMGKGKQPLNSVVPQPAAKATIAEMSSNFEEWMKMATDNKINAANSWNFALIDYFHDMSLLRNDDDNSINFQRASCTLDGCVKIWTSRVDSVGTETTKLLSNLASGGRDEEEENDSDNPDAGPTQKKKKSTRSANRNLATSAESLQNKKLDLEFSVDPLFKKTCADFDEGGASGLLMNHLSLGLGGDGGMRVIFDASDSVFKEEEEEPEEPEDLIDLTELKDKFLPDLSALDGKAISHSLAGFTFSKDFNFDQNNTFFPHATFDDLDDDGGSSDAPSGGDFQMDVDQGGPDPGTEDFFDAPEVHNDDDNYGGGQDTGDDFGGEGQSNTGSVGPGEGALGPAVNFDPRQPPSQRELILAMEGDGGETGLNFFDSTFRQNWAGPEHWKLRRTIRKVDAEAAGGNKTVKPKTKKEPIKIDFLTPSNKDLKAMKEELFAPPGKGATINLPGTGPGKKGAKKKKEKKDDHRLPDDMHFSSKQLVTLFLKPKFYLKMRGKKARVNNDDGEIDENFWAHAAADQARARSEGERDDDNEAHVPFSTQFFNDDDDDGPGGFDDNFGDIGPSVIDAGEQDLLAATQGQTRRLKPETINYARKAKRVDVRKLKENIWKGLDIVIAKPRPEDDEDMDVDEEPISGKDAPTDPCEARQFSQVITGLTQSYPQDKLEEISTSFCFICLLHLANEQGLKLETTDGNAEGDAPVDSIIPDDEDDEIAAEHDKRSGGLWSIKIYRDPTATQSA